MSHNYGKLLFLSIILITTSASFAQNSNKENSPYSRYGIGEFRNGLNTTLKGMGNISTAYSNQYSINTDNPASYADLKLTTYEIGGEGSTRKVYASGQSYGTGMATVSYLNVGVPLGKFMGMNIGLRPFTRTYYNLRDTADIAGLGLTTRNYSGDGSVNYAFIGFGGKYKGFSAGFNFGYLFGTTRYSSILAKVYDTADTYNTDFSRFTKIGDIYWKAGLQYKAELSKKLGLRVGVTISPTQNINAKRDDFGISWRFASGFAIYDTAVNTQGLRGEIILPSSYSFGAQLFGTDKWMAGIDISMSQWGDYKNFGSTDSVSDNTFKVGIGGEYTPKQVSRNYLQRVTYRLGFYYGTDYVKLRNTSLNYYALTVGASLPFRRFDDRIHLGIEIGKRGTEDNGLIRENFFKFALGISLNDKWFIKRKYD